MPAHTIVTNNMYFINAQFVQDRIHVVRHRLASVSFQVFRRICADVAGQRRDDTPVTLLHKSFDEIPVPVPQIWISMEAEDSSFAWACRLLIDQD